MIAFIYGAIEAPDQRLMEIFCFATARYLHTAVCVGIHFTREKVISFQVKTCTSEENVTDLNNSDICSVSTYSIL